jgi:hypothetical protein
MSDPNHAIHQLIAQVREARLRLAAVIERMRIERKDLEDQSRPLINRKDQEKGREDTDPN